MRRLHICVYLSYLIRRIWVYYIMAYSEDTLIKDILTDDRAVAIVEQHFPGATSHPAIDDAQYMTLGEVMSLPQAIVFRGKLQKVLVELASLDGDD